jgi:hypothetical protein
LEALFCNRIAIRRFHGSRYLREPRIFLRLHHDVQPEQVAGVRLVEFELHIAVVVCNMGNPHGQCRHIVRQHGPERVLAVFAACHFSRVGDGGSQPGPGDRFARCRRHPALHRDFAMAGNDEVGEVDPGAYLDQRACVTLRCLGNDLVLAVGEIVEGIGAVIARGRLQRPHTPRDRTLTAVLEEVRGPRGDFGALHRCAVSREHAPGYAEIAGRQLRHCIVVSCGALIGGYRLRRIGNALRAAALRVRGLRIRR